MPESFPAPDHGLVVTHFLTVRDVAVSRQFYADVFGGEVVLAENPATVRVANTWIIMNPGGGPTPDKPDVVSKSARRPVSCTYRQTNASEVTADEKAAAGRRRIRVRRSRSRPQPDAGSLAGHPLP